MREIKFRYYFKCKTLGYIHQIHYHLNQIEERPTNKLSPFFDEDDYKFLGRCQFTGARAGHPDLGIEIYEGDIVELIEPSHTTELLHSDPAVIRFREYGFHLVQTDGEMDFLSNQRNNIRIIGNIYEHPHLLEVNE